GVEAHGAAVVEGMHRALLPPAGELRVRVFAVAERGIVRDEGVVGRVVEILDALDVRVGAHGLLLQSCSAPRTASAIVRIASSSRVVGLNNRLWQIATASCASGSAQPIEPP